MSDIAARLEAMQPEERHYALRTLPAHLAGAAHNDRLYRILTSLGFIQAKVAAFGPEPLIADYALVPGDEGLRVVQSALRLSAHVLAEDSQQLYGQLAARLDGLSAAAIDAILDEEPGRPWLRPHTRSLVLAGAPLVRSLIGHTDDVYEIVVLADGSGVVSVSDDGTIIVWDVTAGVELRRLGDPGARRSAGVTAAAMLPDGVRLLVGRRNGALELWNVESGAVVGSLPAEHRDVGAVAPFPDGRRVLTASMNGVLHIYDLDRRVALHSHSVSHGTLTSAAIAAGEKIIYGAGSKAAVWNPHTGEDTVFPFLENCYVTSLTAIDSGEVLLAARNGDVHLLDVERLRGRRRILVSRDAAVEAAVPLPGARILSATWDGKLDVWDATNETRVASIDTGAGIRSLAVLHDGRRAVTGGPDGVLRVWDLSAASSPERVSVPREHGQAVYFVGIVDPRRAVSLAHDGALKVWSIDDGRELLAFQLHDPVTTPGGWSVALAGSIVIAASSHGEIASVSLEIEGSVERWEGHRIRATAICSLTDGRRALSSGMSGDIRQWDLRSGVELFSFDVTKWGLKRGLHIRSLHALGDGKHGIAVFLERPAHVFEITSGALVHTLPAAAMVHAALPGNSIVLVHSGGEWQLVDALGGETVRRLPGPRAPIDEVAVADDARSAVTLYRSGRLDLWRLEDGEILCGFGADTQLSACAVSRDGKLVVAGDRSGRIHFLALEHGARTAAGSGAHRERRAWWRFWSGKR